MTSREMTAVSCPLPPMEDINPVTKNIISVSTPEGQPRPRTVTCDQDLVESSHNLSVISSPPVPLHTSVTSCEAQERDYISRKPLVPPKYPRHAPKPASLTTPVDHDNVQYLGKSQPSFQSSASCVLSPSDKTCQRLSQQETSGKRNSISSTASKDRLDLEDLKEISRKAMSRSGTVDWTKLP